MAKRKAVFDRAEFAEQFNREQANLRLAKYTLYRDLFPWFGPAMVEAGYRVLEPEPATVREVWNRAHAAWTDATKMRPLNTNLDWDAAAKAAEWRGEPGDIASAREAIFRWAYGMVAGRKEPAEPTAYYLGNRKYQVGTEPAFMLTESEDTVLRSLIELGSAAEKPDLIKQSGVDDCGRVLKSIRDKHAELAPFIILPGGRGKGGYRTTIKANQRN